MNFIKLLIILIFITACGSKENGKKNMESKRANRLINEKSPYLLQHAYNPVDWYPWGEEAFLKAKKEGKPIFLSIGYSTCHWCHVMERESFEDSTVAALMNEVFVSIKVDREERPDIDNIYMTVCQMMTGHGGWPMTIIMTPDKKPFFAGTYFPKESKYGRIGLIDLIGKIKDVWKNRKSEVTASAEKISGFLSETNSNVEGASPNKIILKKAFDGFAERYDNEFGGFGNAPKFPSPHNLLFLLRYWKETNDDTALNMVENTLDKMRLGGIYDHLGGGFHRYSTDRKWLLPHFEKMLYDQGMLALIYTETFAATRKQVFKTTAEEILNYVLRDMTSEKGGFYSAEDADSEGEEGKFYVWSTDEIRNILSEEETELFIETYNLTDDGNFIDESERTRNGKNIPHLSNPLEATAKIRGENPQTFMRKIAAIKKKLFVAREKRVHPFKDDKILTDWNGLTIAAFAEAGRIFENDDYINAAVKAFNFILNYMSDNGILLHRYRKGEAAIEAKLDDYSYSIFGALELYKSTFDVKYLLAAVKWNNVLLDEFYDDENGGFFLTSKNAEQLLIRPKDLYDSAIPSGNSIEYYNLIKLYRLTAEEKLLEYIEKTEKLLGGLANKAPTGFSMFLTAAAENIYGTKEIVIAEGKNGIGEFTKAINKNYNLDITVLVVPKNDRTEIYRVASFAKDYTAINGRTAVYVCRNFVCELPVTEALEMLALIDK